MSLLINLLNSSYEVNVPYKSRRNRDIFMTYVSEIYSLTKTSYGPELFCRSSLKKDNSLITNFLRTQQYLVLNDPRRRYLTQDSFVNTRKFPILKAGYGFNSMFFLDSIPERSNVQPIIIARLESTFNVLKLMFFFKKKTLFEFL